jgi:phosphoglycerol transferase MdoB-like AlkP superfamily enzyme
MVVEPLNDVMSYFKFAFLAYIVLFIIIVLNFYKSLYIRKNLPPNNPIGKLIQRFDLVIDIFCGIAMAAGLMFQGVLADNNALGHDTWFIILLAISIVSFIIFVVNVIVVRREKK